ncbi:MAG: response regulator transcription factor [Armatimonadaceae bacterium]
MNETGDEIRVCIIAGYASVRAGLHALLSDAPDIIPMETVEGVGEPLVRLLPARVPDVLLLDTSGEENGSTLADLLELLVALDSPHAVVVIGDDPETDLPRLAQATLPGWSYLLREADGPQIIQATRSAAAGLVTLDRTLARATLRGDTEGTNGERLSPEELSRSIGVEFPGEVLTPREVEVLELMAEGLPNKIIASRLNISLHTAKFHVAQILGKLDAASRTEAVTIGARRGYVTL